MKYSLEEVLFHHFSCFVFHFPCFFNEYHDTLISIGAYLNCFSSVIIGCILSLCRLGLTRISLCTGLVICHMQQKKATQNFLSCCLELEPMQI